MKIKKHYKNQLAYFEREFRRMKDYHLSPWQRSYVKRVKDYMLEKDFRKKKLLDIATGSGYIAIEMARLGMKVIACDFSSQAIKNLKEVKKKNGLKNLKLIECFAEDIPLKSGTIDYIVANAILEHIPEEEKAIEKWKRLLKSGGKMFITAPLKFRYLWPFFWPINYLHDRQIGHLRRYDLSSLQNKFPLKVVKIFYTGHLLKVLGAMLGSVYKSETLEEYFERIDEKLVNNRYGASNISVIFQK